MNRKNCKKLNFTKWKQQSNLKLTQMKRVFYWCFCFVSRDHHETTFVTLNRFCPLGKPAPAPSPPHPYLLFLTGNINLDGILIKFK